MSLLRLLLMAVLFICSTAARSQERMRLAGYVEMPGMPLTDYYLEISVQNGEVKGYSITNYKDGNRLKASVVGRMKTASELYIEETRSLDTKDLGQTYCYFKANLKLSVYRTSRRWSGPFESRQTDGFSCGYGLMTIMENAPPLDAPTQLSTRSENKPGKIQVKQEPPAPKPKPVVPKDTVAKAPQVAAPKPELPRPEPPKPKPVVLATPVEVKRPPVAPVKIDTNHCMRSIKWTGDSLRLEIWDGWTADGDVVSVYWGGQLVLDHKKLGVDKLSYWLPVKKGINFLDILMFEEGFDPPNTPDIVLYGNGRAVPLRVSGSVGDKVRICVERGQ